MSSKKNKVLKTIPKKMNCGMIIKMNSHKKNKIAFKMYLLFLKSYIIYFSYPKFLKQIL